MWLIAILGVGIAVSSGQGIPPHLGSRSGPSAPSLSRSALVYNSPVIPPPGNHGSGAAPSLLKPNLLLLSSHIPPPANTKQDNHFEIPPPAGRLFSSDPQAPGSIPAAALLGRGGGPAAPSLRESRLFSGPTGQTAGGIPPPAGSSSSARADSDAIPPPAGTGASSARADAGAIPQPAGAPPALRGSRHPSFVVSGSPPPPPVASWNKQPLNPRLFSASGGRDTKLFRDEQGSPSIMNYSGMFKHGHPTAQSQPQAQGGVMGKLFGWIGWEEKNGVATPTYPQAYKNHNV